MITFMQVCNEKEKCDRKKKNMSFREIKNLRKPNAKAKSYAKKVAVNYMNTTEETPSTLHYNSGRVPSGQEHLAKLLTSERRRSVFSSQKAIAST